MSKLEELLQGVDVEWKAIDDIIKVITAPCKVKKEIYKPIGKTPIIDQGKEYIAGYTDENFETVIADEYILFGDHSEHIKYVNFSFIQGADGLKILKIKNDFHKYIYKFRCSHLHFLSHDHKTIFAIFVYQRAVIHHF